MKEGQGKNILVVGMGAYAFGKERRAVRTLKQMQQVRPYFLTSKWEDGSVGRLLRQHEFDYTVTSFGYLGRARPIWTLINVVHLPILLGTVLKTYRKQQCEAILILAIREFVNALAVILLLRYVYRAKLIFYLGDIPPNNRIYRICARMINRLAHRIVVISEAVKQGLTAIGIDAYRVQVVYNGIELSHYANAVPLDLRKRYQWPSHTVLVGYAGQFNPNKGVWDFVKAAEQVLQRAPNCRFLMIGKVDDANQQQQTLAEYINIQGLNDSIRFTGWIEDMENAYAALDVLVVPSQHEEPLGNVNIEATASGVPIIGTRSGGIPEIVVDGETGFLADKASPEQIAGYLLRLAGDADLRRTMGDAGKRRARQMFDVRTNARRVEEILLNA